MKAEAGGPRIARLLLFLLLAAPAAAQTAGDALTAARARRLWEDPQWLRLVHYKRSRWLGREESDATKGFFLSPNGAHDPRAELEADVAGLYAVPPPDGSQHPRCRFPARSAWLIETLRIDPASLPPADCSKFEAWRRLL
ncbi:MAG TPA: DUF4105 domain-containing protein, partial [Elusimicrobiota bacterium]|nr:DUF4105 domain-containing protein [Elusimicrobiota bacterium]